MRSSGGSEARGSARSCNRRTHYAIRATLPLEAGAGSSERVDRDVFVDMYGLCVLTQIVKTRETTRAMALKRTLSRMFAGIVSKPAQVKDTYRI